MKTLRDTYPRVSIWYKVKELFEEEHYSVNKINQLTGLHRSTITRYLQMSESKDCGVLDYLPQNKSKPSVNQ